MAFMFEKLEVYQKAVTFADEAAAAAASFLSALSGQWVACRAAQPRRSG